MKKPRRKTSVTVPKVVADNIEQLIDSRLARADADSLSLRIADKITQFSGSVACLWFHAVWFSTWVLLNLKSIPGAPLFDPFPFGLLTLIVSLEAIFLSTILLLSQNRLQEASERRAELDLHINLLAERESTTILRKLARIEKSLGIEVCAAEKKHVAELLQDTNPVDIVSTIEKTTARRAAPAPAPSI